MTLSILFSLSLMMQAQNRPSDGRVQQTPKERAAEMTKQLELTADQQTQVEALFVKQDEERAKFRKENRANNQAAGADREKMRTQFLERRKAENAELEKIIGTEKMKEYQKYLNENREQRSPRGKRK